METNNPEGNEGVLCHFPGLQAALSLQSFKAQRNQLMCLWGESARVTFPPTGLSRLVSLTARR